MSRDILPWLLNLGCRLFRAKDPCSHSQDAILTEQKPWSKVSLQVSTVATTMTLAEQNHAEELKRVCLEFVSKNLSAVMVTEGYQHMMSSCPTLQVHPFPLQAPLQRQNIFNIRWLHVNSRLTQSALCGWSGHGDCESHLLFPWLHPLQFLSAMRII